MSTETHYITLDKENKEQVLATGNVVRANYSSTRDAYRDSVVVREDMNRKDYEYLRPDSKLPQDAKGKIDAAMEAYRMGIVRNIIDMMADFVCKGVDLAHPTKSVEKFYKEWWKKIRGQNRSERIANTLYRTANVVVTRAYANLKPKQKQELSSGELLDNDVEPQQTALRSNYRIPWSYTVQNPVALEVLGGDIDLLLGKDKLRYGVRLNQTLLAQINDAKIMAKYNKNRPVLIQSLLNISGAGEPDIYPLPENDTIAMFYKKDDWELWAVPMTDSILPDLQVYNKLRLTDLAALDGACNYLRIIKLGDLDSKLWPTAGAFAELSGMLQSNSAGGPMDIVWGPDIDLIESKTDIANFLNNEKYVPTLNAIYTGLGIPPALVGLNQSSTTGSAFFTLKTLIERLEYVRNIITAFWENELNIVAREMNFASPAKLVFDTPTISDESTENKLLIELLDRNIISAEAVLERTNYYPLIEKARLNQEKKARERGKMPEKVSALQLPEQQMKMADKTVEGQIKVVKAKPVPKAPGLAGKKKGKPGQGRAKGQKDASKRKPRALKPRTKAVAGAMAWARESQRQVSDILTPLYLKAVDKKNLRQLTIDEFNSLEAVKFKVLIQCEPETKVTEDFVIEKLGTEIESELFSARDSIIEENKDKSIDYIRDLEASMFASESLEYFGV